jgi:hypothetical protein
MAHVEGKKSSLLDRIRFTREDDIVGVVYYGVIFALGGLFASIMTSLDMISEGNYNVPSIFICQLVQTWSSLDILANFQLLSERNLFKTLFWTWMTLIDIFACSAGLIVLGLIGGNYSTMLNSVAFPGMIVVNKIMCLSVVYKDYKKGRRDVDHNHC